MENGSIFVKINFLNFLSFSEIFQNEFEETFFLENLIKSENGQKNWQN